MIKELKELLRKATGKDEKPINRREALTKESCMALSTATMMILVKSHPVKEQSPVASPPKLNQYPTGAEYWRTRTALG